MLGLMDIMLLYSDPLLCYLSIKLILQFSSLEQLLLYNTYSKLFGCFDSNIRLSTLLYLRKCAINMTKKLEFESLNLKVYLKQKKLLCGSR